MSAYFVIFAFCIAFDSAKVDGKRSISFRKQSNALSNCSQAELDLMDMSVLQQLKKNMGQTVKMYLNWLLALTMFCAGVVFMGVMSLWLVPYLMVKFEYTRSTAAMVSGLAFMSSGVGSILIGIISKKVSRRKVFLFEGNALLLAFVALIYLDATMLPMPFVIVLCIVTGIGFSHFSPFVFTICREYNWFYGNTETATAFVNMGLVLSGAVGQLIIGELLDIHWKGRADHAMDGDLRVYSVEDFNFALMIVPISLCIMFVSSMLLTETHSKNLEYEPKAKKKAMPKMQKVKTTDIELDIEDEAADGDKDSYGTNTANTASQEEMTSLNNDSAEDDGNYH
jgi:sugar phosphate permease